MYLIAFANLLGPTLHVLSLTCPWVVDLAARVSLDTCYVVLIWKIAHLENCYVLGLILQ